MRHGSSSNRRQRSRGGSNRGNGGRRSGGQQKTQVYDSNGPDVRIRGTAYQVTEKYAALARDANAAGDIVLAQSYLQYAEHYQRIISSWNLEEKAQADDRSEGRAKDESAVKEKTQQKEDLSLPASILGEEAKASSEAKSDARTAELSNA